MQIYSSICLIYMIWFATRRYMNSRSCLNGQASFEYRISDYAIALEDLTFNEL